MFKPKNYGIYWNYKFQSYQCRKKAAVICCTYLLVWIDVYMALNTLLAHVCPRVARHPLPLALGALVLAETALLALVRCHSLAFGTRLQRKETSRPLEWMIGVLGHDSFIHFILGVCGWVVKALDPWSRGLRSDGCNMVHCLTNPTSPAEF